MLDESSRMYKKGRPLVEYTYTYALNIFKCIIYMSCISSTCSTAAMVKCL